MKLNLERKRDSEKWARAQNRTEHNTTHDQQVNWQNIMRRQSKGTTMNTVFDMTGVVVVAEFFSVRALVSNFFFPSK